MKVKLGKYNKQSERSVDVTIDRFDTFSLDHTLAHIILPCLIQLKATKMGIPSEFADSKNDWSQQQAFDFYEEGHDEAFNLCVKRWEDTLDKMIWSFQQIVLDDYEKQYYHGTPKYDWVKTDQQFVNPLNGKTEDTFQMVDLNPGEHWIDFEGMRMHEERIQEGLELFGKYYRHLWD